MALGVLALDQVVRGDVHGAKAQLSRAVRRVDELSFPQAHSAVPSLISSRSDTDLEAHQFDRAAVLASALIDLADRHGFEVWALWGAAQLATVNALASVGAQDSDPDVVSVRVEQMAAMVNAVRGAGLTIYVALFDGALGRVLTATGQLDRAGAQLGHRTRDGPRYRNVVLRR